MDPGAEQPAEASPASTMDVETLRLAYAEVLARMEVLRQETHRLLAEFAALPLTAGGIITLFFAFRPEDLPGAFPYLYGLTVVPFLLLFWMAFSATESFVPVKVAAKLADEEQLTDQPNSEDYLPHRDWLLKSTTSWRIAAVVGTKYNSQYRLYLQRIRLVFAFLVVYLVAITFAALLAA